MAGFGWIARDVYKANTSCSRIKTVTCSLQRKASIVQVDGGVPRNSACQRWVNRQTCPGIFHEWTKLASIIFFLSSFLTLIPDPIRFDCASKTSVRGLYKLPAVFTMGGDLTQRAVSVSLRPKALAAWAELALGYEGRINMVVKYFLGIVKQSANVVLPCIAYLAFPVNFFFSFGTFCASCQEGFLFHHVHLWSLFFFFFVTSSTHVRAFSAVTKCACACMCEHLTSVMPRRAHLSFVLKTNFFLTNQRMESKLLTACSLCKYGDEGRTVSCVNLQ